VHFSDTLVKGQGFTRGLLSEVLKKKEAVLQALFSVRDIPESVISSHFEFTPVQVDPFSSTEGVAQRCSSCLGQVAVFEPA
jgi:hypothetical protein